MKTGGIQLRVGDLLYALQKRWKVIISLTIVGLVFGLLLSGVGYVQGSLTTYEIQGSVAVSSVNLSDLYRSGSTGVVQNYFHLAEDMVDGVTYLLKSDRVLEEVINDGELLGITTSSLKSSISYKQYLETQIIDIRIVWPSDTEGVALWNSIVAHTQQAMPETLGLGSLLIVNAPSVQVLGMGGGGNYWMLLSVLGFAAGAGYAVMELLMHPTLTNLRDVETVLGLETLAVIPRDNAYFRKRTSMLVENDSVASDVEQSYATAAYIIRNRLGTREKHHCFYVTSAGNREGRSSAAAYLAIQLSDMEHKTLLIDFDTRNPSLGAMFLNNVDYARSLNALYRGDINVSEAITSLTGYLDLLPTVLEHNAIMMDGTIVELIQKISENYEYVIVDAPPVGTVSDTLSLNQIAGTVLFVAGYDMSTVPDIQAALSKLDKSGIRVLGCIVNFAQNRLSLTSGDEIKAKKRKKKKAKEKDFGQQPDTLEKDGVEELVSKQTPKKAKEKRSMRKKQAAEVKSEAEEPKPAAPVKRDVMADLMSESTEPKREASAQDSLSALLELSSERSSGDKTEPKN